MTNNWNGIYGQTIVKEILENLINSSKIPHAILFSGIEGIGKDFVALRFAQTLNSKFLNPNEAEHINNLISNFSEPYIKYIYPLPRGKNESDSTGPTEKLSLDEIQIIKDEISKKIQNPYHKITIPKASNIKISSIRDIKKFLSFDYSDIIYRIVLISDAHLMNEEAQNALLKSLEEPPEGVIFILTTPFPNNLRETIRSRCWVINFQPLSSDDLSKILISKFNIEEKLAKQIAPFSGGSVVNALRLLENAFEELLEKTILILRYSFGKKYYSALNEFSVFLSENNPESIKLLINMIIVWLNDVQKYRYQNNNIYFEGYVETIQKFNKRFPDVDVNFLVSKLEKLATIIHNNVNLNLIVLNIVYELSTLTFPFKN
jgi:DNA polymerase-3 subunit delta'